MSGGQERGRLHLYGPPEPPRSEERAKHFWPSLKRLAADLRPEHRLIALAVALTVVRVACTVAAPKVLARAINLIFEGAVSRDIPAGVSKEQVIATLQATGDNKLASMLSGMDIHPGQGVDIHAVGRVILVVTAIYFLAALLSWLQGYLTAGVTQRTIYRLRSEVELKIDRLPLSFFDRHARGDVLSRLTNDMDNVEQATQQVLSQVLGGVLNLAGLLAMMFWISPLLAVVSLATLPLAVGVAGAVARHSQKQFALQWERTGALNGHVEEMFTGHSIVKMFGGQDDAIAVFDRHNEGVRRSSFKAQFISGIIMPAMLFGGNLNYVAVCVLGGLRVASGTMTLGDVQAFVQYVQQTAVHITQTAGIASIFQSAVASAERVFEMLDEAEESPDPAQPADLAESSGHIVFSHVSFRYLPDTPLIEDLNLEVTPGQTVAIVGPTGAGKTTLVNLLMRFYEIDQGSIAIDGIDTKTMTRDGLRRLFGMVLQDTWLFAGTIGENIAYGREDATREEIRAAAEAAHADHFVRALPEGYETTVEDDSTNISQGERQLLTIARAFLADPQILILDEATSSVDTRTEVLIQRAMARLLRGRTSFVIAHRLSTIRDADLILVMSQGAIVEQGTHQELLCRRGFYFDLYNSQFAEALQEAC